MKWILFGLLLSSNVFAETSKIIPAFLEASDLYIQHEVTSETDLYLRPDIRSALAIFEKNQIDPEILAKYTNGKNPEQILREDDEFDAWVKNPIEPVVEVPAIAVHAYKLDVIQQSDTWFADNVYAYFFVTDGVIPTGKVTSIYKGVSGGQAFFFNEIDRAIFPLVGISAKKPQNHLIVDYGIIESDGDDIKELQKLSSIIIDIAIAVYASYDPQTAQVLMNLRKEIKALADMLLTLNKDDRLATGSLGYQATKIEEMLREKTYVEVTRSHHSAADFDTWRYKISFRFLREN